MRTRSSLLAGTVVVVLLVGCGAALASPPEIAEGQAKAPQAKLEAPWLHLESGLKKARAGPLPIVVLYAVSEQTAPETAPAAGEAKPDGEDRAGLSETFQSYLRDSSFKKALRDYVLVFLTPEDLEKPFPAGEARDAGKAGRGRKARADEEPPPDPVGKKLALHAGKPALLVLSFREQVVRRYLDELPGRAALRKELARIARVNTAFFKEDRRVGAILEKSLYAFEAGKRKAAVTLVLPFTKPGSRRLMDDTLRERVDSVIDKYRKVAEKEMKTGDLLDAKRQYKEAIDTFEVVLQDFPFPDIRKDAAIRKGEVWRKVQLFTRIPR